MLKILLVAIASCTLALAVSASPVTVVLAVPSMDCPVCPITVKKALTGVPGVRKASVDFERRQATVTFDDNQTKVEVLTRATANAGYPSTLADAAAK
jgi:mercuric ion binding protein